MLVMDIVFYIIAENQQTRQIHAVYVFTNLLKINEEINPMRKISTQILCKHLANNFSNFK